MLYTPQTLLREHDRSELQHSFAQTSLPPRIQVCRLAESSQLIIAWVVEMSSALRLTTVWQTMINYIHITEY